MVLVYRRNNFPDLRDTKDQTKAIDTYELVSYYKTFYDFT